MSYMHVGSPEANFVYVEKPFSIFQLDVFRAGALSFYSEPTMQSSRHERIVLVFFTTSTIQSVCLMQHDSIKPVSMEKEAFTRQVY